MCEVGTIVGLVISIAASAASYVQADQAAKRQEKAIRASADQSQAVVADQKQQILSQEASNLFDIKRAQTREDGSLRAAAGESGLGGISMASILNDTTMQAGFESSRVNSDTEKALKQNALEAKGLATQASSNINQIQRPSAFGTGLQIAGSAVSAYSQHKALDAKLLK